MLAVWALFIATVGLLWYWSKSDNKNTLKDGLKEIPGPKGYPLIGNLLELSGGHIHKQFAKWAKQYGSLCKVKIGPITSIIVSDPKLTKELFNETLLTGRVRSPGFDLYEETPGLGIVNSEGERWAVHRRFLLRHLRDFGFGKSSIETFIMEEVQELIQMFKKKVGTPVGEIREKLRLATVNSLWQMLSSERFDQSDPRLIKLADNTSRSFNEVVQKGGVLFFIPWMRRIIPELCGYNAIRKILEENKEFMVEGIQECKKNFREDEEPKNFIGVYLAEMKKNEGDPSSHFYGELAERQLAAICFDMFLAGSDTTATTTAWAFLYLCKFSQIQERFQQEMFEITGDTRNVSLTDRPNMPYTLALIDEILRFSTIAPDGAPHRVLADMEFHGYYFPKDALVQPSTYSIHFDEKLWGDPEIFRPERFLSEDGKKYVKNDNLQLFMIGKRQCLGESLARDNLFLFLTNIFQQFSMKFDPNEDEPGLESEIGLIIGPLPYKVVMTDRLVK